jgi:hypothetical protein
VLEKSDRAVSRANRPSFQLRSFCLVIHFTDGFNYGLRLVELDVLRAIVGEDLFRVRRQFEPACLGHRDPLLIFEVLRSVRGLSLQVADSVVSRGENADGTRAE